MCLRYGLTNRTSFYTAVGYLGACSMNTPHTHPRATEINFAVNGSLRTGMLAENGARFVFNDVPAGSATVFPRGAIHFEMNLECGEFFQPHLCLFDRNWPQNPHYLWQHSIMKIPDSWLWPNDVRLNY
jgi:Cupin